MHQVEHEPYLDEALIDTIWSKLGRQVPRDEVLRVAREVATRYHNARITQYVPIFILRRTYEILQARARSKDG